MKNYEELNAIINKKREANIKQEDEARNVDLAFELPVHETINMVNFSKKDLEAVNDIALAKAFDFFSIKDEEAIKAKLEENFLYCDSKKFLHQDYFKDVYIFGKRGVGKSYSLYEWIVDEAIDLCLRALSPAIEKNDRDPVNIPLYFGILLQNVGLTGNMIDTFNEFLVETPNEHTEWIFEIVNDKLMLKISVDTGASIKFRKSFIMAEFYYLTLPMRARNKQHKNLLFMIMDEVEKAFANSLLDENLNIISADMLYKNFLEMKNSFNRNAKIRWLYFGNVTNASSPLWEFLELDNFNFVKKIIEDERGKSLVLNVIRIFFNKDMETIYEDMTTQGISEISLFKLDHLINEDNVIKEVNNKTQVLLTNTKIFYFHDNICNVETIGMKSMKKLNGLMDKEFEIEYEEVVGNVKNQADDWLRKQGYTPHEALYKLVPANIMNNRRMVKGHAKIKVYNISRMKIEGSIILRDPKEYLGLLKYREYLFNNERAYLALQELVN